MTTQDHSANDRIVATYPNGDAARRAEMAIEALGIESSRVSVDTKADLTSHVAERNVDVATVSRTRRTAVQGMIVGGVIGAVIGVILGVVLDVLPTGIALALFIIPGVILGAFYGVFTRLETNPEIADAAVGGPVRLTVDLSSLGDAERAAAMEKLRASQPTQISPA